jgi:hypothetical protein
MQLVLQFSLLLGNNEPNSKALRYYNTRLKKIIIYNFGALIRLILNKNKPKTASLNAMMMQINFNYITFINKKSWKKNGG